MWVYGIQCGEFIKIGVAQNIGVRRKQFQAGNPLPLNIVVRCKCPNGAYLLERYMHKILAEFSIGREWFRASPEQVRNALEVAKVDLEARHEAQRGWELESAERAEKRKAEKEAKRLARGELERAALVERTWTNP